MAMGACPGQIPMPCVPPALMVTATMVRACRYVLSRPAPGRCFSCCAGIPVFTRELGH